MEQYKISLCYCDEQGVGTKDELFTSHMVNRFANEMVSQWAKKNLQIELDQLDSLFEKMMLVYQLIGEQNLKDNGSRTLNLEMEVFTSMYKVSLCYCNEHDAYIKEEVVAERYSGAVWVVEDMNDRWFDFLRVEPDEVIPTHYDGALGTFYRMVDRFSGPKPPNSKHINSRDKLGLIERHLAEQNLKDGKNRKFKIQIEEINKKIISTVILYSNV